MRCVKLKNITYFGMGNTLSPPGLPGPNNSYRLWWYMTEFTGDAEELSALNRYQARVRQRHLCLLSIF